ncbi:MAG: DJ-1/PfpI family protein [Roseburia sp.]|nr:DJ-1/PfpI family protein [Roseburia sp.]MCM1243000.1 DJ-1/PfpI family protein [Roseburia sp.]
MQKLALLVYPEFSLQEVMNLSRLFRWDYDILTEVISTGKEPVKSEEGIVVLPQKTVHEFRTADYLCLILPGCSDFTEAFKDKELFDFLGSFRGDNRFVIGAICSRPLFLARAGVLAGKKFTASIYMDLFDFCPFLERENYVPAPLVTADNIVTAGGSNFNGFAVEMAHLLGLECPERILSGYMDSWTKEDYEEYLPEEAIEETRAMFDEIYAD